MSDDVPDEIISPNPRFAALTRNIRIRRGSKVDIRVPIKRERYTREEDLREGIRMDAMAYGMGSCCLQVTFQARDIDESRHLYDHLAVLSPIMLALTAATPVLHGRLADTDVRWHTISAAVDCRTPAERGEATAEAAGEAAGEAAAEGIEGGEGEEAEGGERVAGGAGNGMTAKQQAMMAGGGRRRLPKSRYESISLYLANCGGCHRRYNDVDPPIDNVAFKLLRQAGVDEALATHVAHLFVRDPLVIMEERIRLDDTVDTDHFENIQSTNWQTVRWKPPPHPSSCGPRVGWRVEFRSMEVQPTDFENAAFTVFVVLVSRVILAFDLNLYLPLSKVDENMRRAHSRSAVSMEKFFFRKHMAPPPQAVDDPDGYEEMTISEIMEGKGSYFPGLIPLIYAYLESIECDGETYALMHSYLEFIRRRALGELQTPAQWMRDQITRHPEYAHDSIVTEPVAASVVKRCIDAAEGRAREPRLLGENVIPPLRTDGAWCAPRPRAPPRPRLLPAQSARRTPTAHRRYVPLKPHRIDTEQREALLSQYAKRVRDERNGRG